MQKTLPIYLAPLQGYTEAPYRNAHAACFGGVDAYYTPFVRMEKGGVRSKDIRDIEPGNNRVSQLVPQLIASEAGKAERILSLFIEKGYREVDINLGCPFPMLAKRHNGSGILPYPEEVRSLLSIVAQYPQIQFSVKMRLGWEQADECLALVQILNDLPLKQITMHPRLGKQQYKGEVDLEGFTRFYEVCKHSLVYNGDLISMEDIQRITGKFPNLSALMLGRGLLANPALAVEYKENRKLSSDVKTQKVREMHEQVFHHYEQRLQGGESQLLNKMKTFWEHLLPDADRKMLKAIRKSNRLQVYEQAVNSLFNYL